MMPAYFWLISQINCVFEIIKGVFIAIIISAVGFFITLLLPQRQADGATLCHQAVKTWRFVSSKTINARFHASKARKAY